MRTALVSRLRQNADDVQRITTGIADEALARRSAPETWSVAELVCHLLRVQRLFEGRIAAMLEQDAPRFESYAPENDAGFTEFVASYRGQQAVAALVTERRTFADRLDALTDDQWQRRGRHPTFDTFDVAFLVEYMHHHEAHHLYQMFVRSIPLRTA